MEEDYDNSQCVTNLQTEIHNLQDENTTLFDKIKRMEKNWDSLIQQASSLGNDRIKLDKEVAKMRSILQGKDSMLQKLGVENKELQGVVSASWHQTQKLNHELQSKQEQLFLLESESEAAKGSYNESTKSWKEERRTIVKQKEEVSKKLDACEDELQAYLNENAKIEKQLKQITKDFTHITSIHTQLQDMLDAKENSWQKFVRRLGPRYESIIDVFKSALATSLCAIESGGLSPAAVLIANYVHYWRILHVQNVNQMVAVIIPLRDFLIEHYMDQDSVLYLLSCVSLLLHALHSGHGNDLDENIMICLDDYNVLENVGILTRPESYCGSGYSSDSSDYNTEGTAGYTSESTSGTDGNESSTSSNSGSPIFPPAPQPQVKKNAGRPKYLRAPSGMLNMIKPLLFKRNNTKTNPKPPLMSDSDASTENRFNEFVSPPSAPSRLGTESGYSSPTSISDSGSPAPRSAKNTAKARTRRGASDAWDVTVRNSFEFFVELNFVFSMTMTVLIKRIFVQIDEIMEFSRIEDLFARFCAFRASDAVGQPPTRLALGDLVISINSIISDFEDHMIYISLARKIFEEIFARVGKMLVNIVILKSAVRCQMFGQFLKMVWERLDIYCKGNEWTGYPEKQLSLIRQCARLLCAKDKADVDNMKKREKLFPDLSENQIRHIIADPHSRPRTSSNPSSPLAPHPSSSHPNSYHISPPLPSLPTFSSFFVPSPSHPSNPTHASRKSHENAATNLLLFSDLDCVRPISVRSAHYLGMDELQKLPVPPFLVGELRISDLPKEEMAKN